MQRKAASHIGLANEQTASERGLLGNQQFA